MSINNKTTLIIVAVVLFTIGVVLFLYSTQSPDMDAAYKHSECIKYNDGLRSGSCTKDAPSYCTTVYYPPSCKTCQDGRGCGFKE